MKVETHRFFPLGNDIPANKIKRACKCKNINLEIKNETDPIRGTVFTSVYCPLCRAEGAWSTHGYQEAIDNWNNETKNPPIAGDIPVNQCDGCCAKMPLKDGTHYYKDGKPWINCTKNKY